MNLVASIFRTAGVWVPCAVLVCCAAAVKPAQDRVDACFTDRDAVDPDLLYLSSPGAIKSASLGYQSLMADIYWIRAVQYYGRRDEADRRKVRYKNLPALLDITTTLDPNMINVYRAGSSFLAEPEPIGAGQPREALKLLDKGIACHPDEWWFRFDKGFTCFWFLKDYKRAARVWLEASRLQAAPVWMEALAAMALSRSGAVETARALWERQYQHSMSRQVKENAKNHLDSMQVDELLWTIEFLAEKYAARHGRFPARLEDLVTARYLRSVPRDPSGIPLDYDSATGKASLSPDSGVRYLKVPYDYREAFREKLTRTFDRWPGGENP